MSSAENSDGAAIIASVLPAQYIRHSIGNAWRSDTLADCGKTIGASRIRRIPRSRGIDHRVGQNRF